MIDNRQTTISDLNFSPIANAFYTATVTNSSAETLEDLGVSFAGDNRVFELVEVTVEGGFIRVRTDKGNPTTSIGKKLGDRDIVYLSRDEAKFIKFIAISVDVTLQIQLGRFIR